MLQSEFETHTDIFPDVLLYEAADHEYMTGDWDSKAGFCHDFKFNVDGLAQKCQKIANERWIKVNEEVSRLRSEAKPLADICEKLRAENNRLEDENENLRTDIADLTKTVDNLIQQITELPVATLEQVQHDDVTLSKAKMMDSILEAAHADCKGDEILHMVWGFDFLLPRLGAE